MQALIKAARYFNEDAIDVKDYAHVRSIWMTNHSLLNKASSEAIVSAHRFALKNCPTHECFTLLCEELHHVWTVELGEHAFAESVKNFMAGGKHDGWWRGAGLTAGSHSLPHEVYVFISHLCTHVEILAFRLV
jgi:hypothetical protein